MCAFTVTSANEHMVNTAGDQNTNQYIQPLGFPFNNVQLLKFIAMCWCVGLSRPHSHLLNAFSLSCRRMCLCVCVPHSHSKFFTKLILKIHFSPCSGKVARTLCHHRLGKWIFFGINWKFCNTKRNSEKSKLYRYKNCLQSDFSVFKRRNNILFGGLLRTKKETKEGDEFHNRRTKAELALTKKKWFFFFIALKAIFRIFFFCCAAKFQRNLSLVLCEYYFRLKILCLSLPLPFGLSEEKKAKKKIQSESIEFGHCVQVVPKSKVFDQKRQFSRVVRE